MIYFYVLLLRIVAYLDGAPKIISFLVVFGMMSYSTIKRASNLNIDRIPKFIFYGFALATLILFHGLLYGNVLIRDVAVLLTYCMWLTFTYTYFRDKTLKESLRFVFLSFLIFNIANFLHFKIYFVDQKLGLNSILGFFGIVDYRIFFPLSSGANIFTSQLGLNAIITLYFLKCSNRKISYTLTYIFYLYMLVLADSRLILLFTLVFSVAYWFSLKQIVSFFKKTWWIIGVILMTLLYVFYNTSIFDAFKRAGELGGRAVSRIQIWTIAFNIIFDDLNLLFGHGINGFENNIPEPLIKTFKNQRLQTSHNFIIQNFIDFGLAGISIIFFVIYRILLLFLKVRVHLLNILIVMLLLIGITESIPTFYSIEPTLFFITILSIAYAQSERKDVAYFNNS